MYLRSLDRGQFGVIDHNVGLGLEPSKQRELCTLVSVLRAGRNWSELANTDRIEAAALELVYTLRFQRELVGLPRF